MRRGVFLKFDDTYPSVQWYLNILHPGTLNPIERVLLIFLNFFNFNIIVCMTDCFSSFWCKRVIRFAVLKAEISLNVEILQELGCFRLPSLICGVTIAVRLHVHTSYIDDNGDGRLVSDDAASILSA